MARLDPLRDAVKRLSAKTPVGSVLRTAEWARVPLAFRERAQFSAAVESMRVLSTIQERLEKQTKLRRERLASGKTATFDRSSFIDSIRGIAREEGLTPEDEALRGGLQDITSIPRLGLIYDTQNRQATGYARWKLDQSEGALLLWPAQEFLRIEERRVPREDWPGRFAAAARDAGDRAALAAFASTGRMIGLKTSGLWARLNRFGTPWPPFDFGSGMGLEDIDREEAVELGLIGPDTILDSGVEDFNKDLEASVSDLPTEFTRVLQTHFGSQIKVAGGRARWQSDQGEIAERQRSDERQTAGSVFEGGRRDFRAIRSGDGGAAIDDASAGTLIDRWSVEVAAVAAGRKPLFHEHLGDTAPEVARALSQTVPANVIVEARDGHLWAYRPDIISRYANPDRPLTGQVAAHSDDGVWLGYGANWPGDKTVRVAILDEDKNPVAGFRAPADSPELFAKARAEDYAVATGRPHSYLLDRP